MISETLQVLEGLLPPPHLKALGIWNNRGARFPSWMEEHRCSIIFSSLVRLVLVGCCNWECLPTLGRGFPSLKELRIRGASRVKKIGPEFYGGADEGGRGYFPRLEILKLGKMSGWEEWEMPTGEIINGDGGGGRRHLFPSLEKLCIKECPKLPSLFPVLRHLTSLVSIEIKKCDELSFLLEEEGDDECGWMFPSLENLRIEECPKLASLSPILRHSNNLKKIIITKCGELALSEEEVGDDECGWIFPCLQKIEVLSIDDCSPKLRLNLSQMLPHLTALHYLHIGGFRNLQCLPPSIHNLRSLRYLSIEDCPAIECLPDGGLPPSLLYLRIWGCPLLEGRCRVGGPDRPNIPTTTRVL